MSETKASKRAIVAGLVILTILSALFGFSLLVSTLLGLPFYLNFPIPVRALGGAILVIALSIINWLFKYRSPTDMIVSTYATFSKLFRKVPIAERAGRTEPLILRGPQKYVRHPLYLGVVMLVFGWGLLTATTYVLVATAVILIWFLFVLIPFEERELRALFGDQYRKYMDDTPMLVPFTKRKQRLDNS